MNFKNEVEDIFGQIVLFLNEVSAKFVKVGVWHLDFPIRIKPRWVIVERR